MTARDDQAKLLTAQQKACLRLVGRGMSSKEIAQRLGIAPLTVDKHLTSANARLGVASRREAARLFEQSETTQKLGPQMPVIALAGIAREQSVPDQPGNVEPAQQAMHSIVGHGWPVSLVKLPPIGGRRHDLSPVQKMVQASKAALFSLMMVTAIIAVIKGASSLLSL